MVPSPLLGLRCGLGAARRRARGARVRRHPSRGPPVLSPQSSRHLAAPLRRTGAPLAAQSQITASRQSQGRPPAAQVGLDGGMHQDPGEQVGPDRLGQAKTSEETDPAQPSACARPAQACSVTGQQQDSQLDCPVVTPGPGWQRVGPGRPLRARCTTRCCAARHQRRGGAARPPASRAPTPCAPPPQQP